MVLGITRLGNPYGNLLDPGAISLGSSDIQVFGMTCAVLGGRGSHGKTLALAPGTLCWACVRTSVSNLETIRIVKLYYNWQQ